MTDINYLGQRRHREEKKNLQHVGLYCKHLVRAGCPSEKGEEVVTTVWKIAGVLSRSRCCIPRLRAETFSTNIDKVFSFFLKKFFHRN